jgi:hypothetical protein
MNEHNVYRYGSIATILALLVALVAGCSGSQPSPTPEPEAGDETYVSANLDTSYEGALAVSAQLALGTLRLDETAYAVTVDQAGTLLPLWQALRGGALQSEEETNAVLKQIEGTLSGEQLQAIATMQLTLNDLRTWAEGQGLALQLGEAQRGQLSPEARATRQAQTGGQGPDPEAMATRQAQFGGQGRDPEAMATMRAQFENMSDADREAMRATAQAGGQVLGGRGGFGAFAGGLGMARVVLGPLIELLTARAAQ